MCLCTAVLVLGQVLSPQPSDTSFVLWWEKVDEAASVLIKDGVNYTIILGAWTLWNHRNRCV